MKNQKVRKDEELNIVSVKKYLLHNDLINSIESDLFVEQ